MLHSSKHMWLSSRAASYACDQLRIARFQLSEEHSDEELLFDEDWFGHHGPLVDSPEALFLPRHLPQ